MVLHHHFLLATILQVFEGGHIQLGLAPSMAAGASTCDYTRKLARDPFPHFSLL